MCACVIGLVVIGWLYLVDEEFFEILPKLRSRTPSLKNQNQKKKGNSLFESNVHRRFLHFHRIGSDVSRLEL